MWKFLVESNAMPRYWEGYFVPHPNPIESYNVESNYILMEMSNIPLSVEVIFTCAQSYGAKTYQMKEDVHLRVKVGVASSVQIGLNGSDARRSRLN